MEVKLGGFRGNVHKSATVFSNDPKNPKLTISLTAKVNSFIEVHPPNILFRGLPDQQNERTVELNGTSQDFRILNVESNMEGKIAYQLKTVQEGKHYQLQVKNLLDKEGQYRGLLKIKTDHPQKPELLVHVVGNIEGEISVRPQVLSIGRLLAQQPVRSGKVLVISNRNQSFNIKNMNYDTQLIEVVEKPLPQSRRKGFILEIIPKIDNESQGNEQNIPLTFETDIPSDKKHEVKIRLMNR